MELSELTTMMHNFVRDQGWYAESSLRPQTTRNLAISLAIEASEVLEHFQWSNESKNKSALADELADVALYLLQIASIMDIDLEQAICNKIKKNYQRKWD